jgi:TPR repeat protein
MNCRLATLIVFLIATLVAVGQKAEPKPGVEDIGSLKLRAEGSDAQAQVRLAAAYLANGRPSEARRWFEAAAQQNLAEGQFQLGNLLMTGKHGSVLAQNLSADTAAALSWMYAAATNGHNGAGRTLARWLQTGNNCTTNLSEAYAWLTFLADAGDASARNDMNRLALDLSSAEIQLGKAVFTGMKSGQWPAPPLAENSKVGGWLRMQGVAISPKERLAIIGNRTLAEGEQTDFSLDGQTFRMTCLNIDSNSVQVQIEGEAKPRQLRNDFGDGPTQERK